MASRSVLWLALTAALAGCGGGHAAPPDGGDGRLDGDGSGDAPDANPSGAAIVVDTPSGVLATESLDGRCDILEAVAAAAGRKTVDECANPNGVTRILLQAGATYPVKKTLRLASGTEMGLADDATGSATIAAVVGFAVDAKDASSSCLVSVANANPDAWVRDVTLTQDPALTLAGACITRGGLDVRRVRVTGFRAGGIVATCLPASGCDHETDIDQATTLRVLGSLVDGNHSAGKGAGIASEGSGATVVVAHSAIVNNTSDNDGGGVYLGGGWNTQIIQSSTISGNTSNGSGGGLLVRFQEMTNTYVNITNSTIANNTATGNGGGIEFEPARAGRQDVSVFASIVAGNFSTSTLEWNINSDWAPADPPGIFNCVNGSFIYVAPGLPQPTDMGGCTFDVRNPFLGALTPMGGTGDLPLHPLLAGSPAIDGALDDTTPDQQRDGWIKDIDPGTPVEWTMFDPLVDGDGDGTAVRDLGAIERNDRWQTELLAVRAQGPSSHTVVTIPSGYDRGAGTTYAATGTTNELITYALPIGEPGRYDLTVGARSGSDAGKFQIAIADDPAGPWTALGPEQDAYSAHGAFVSFGPFTTPFLASAGEKLVRFTVTGKNPSASAAYLSLDYIEAKKRTNACPVADLTAGGAHTCALMMTSSGGVRCWGSNAAGQLGDGGGADRASPPGADKIAGVTAIAAGGSHTCVLSSGGSVGCWGANTNGQLGDGSTTMRAAPPSGPVLSGVKAIAAGRAHTCALTTTGGVRCWGGNSNGQLGDGSMTDRTTPPSADVLTGVAAIAAGDTHTCALTTAGGVRCWGHNNDGELGIGSYDMVLAPPTTDALTGVKQVVAGNLFTCALTTAGGVRCWGYNSHGEIGDDTIIAVDRLRPATTDILTGVASLTAGFAHVCARMSSGGMRCWGSNDFGQLGDGMTPIFALTPPTLDTPGFRGTCE
jgi:hypothetical protein